MVMLLAPLSQFDTGSAGLSWQKGWVRASDRMASHVDHAFFGANADRPAKKVVSRHRKRSGSLVRGPRRLRGLRKAAAGCIPVLARPRRGGGRAAGGRRR